MNTCVSFQLGTAGRPTTASPEPPHIGVLYESDPSPGRPESRAAPSALPLAGAWGVRPTLYDGSKAPGCLPRRPIGGRVMAGNESPPSASSPWKGVVTHLSRCHQTAQLERWAHPEGGPSKSH